MQHARRGPARSLCVQPRGVQRIAFAHFEVLRHYGLLPPLTHSGVPKDHPRCRVPDTREMGALDWWIAGKADRPSAVMALRLYYDLGANRDVLEVVELFGHRFGNVRLVLAAVALAKEMGRRIVGDVDLDNPFLVNVLLALGFGPTRTRWELEPA